MSYSTMHKAAIKFAKDSFEKEMFEAEQERRKPRFGVMGAKSYHHPGDQPDVKRQYILDGIILVSYSKPFDDLFEYEPNQVLKNIDNLLLDCVSDDFLKGYKGAPLPYLNEVKALWVDEKKRCKGNSKARNHRYRLVIQQEGYYGVVVDIERLIEFMTLTNCKGGEYYHYNKCFDPVFVENDLDDNHIEGVLMPMRVFYEEQCLND